MAGYTPTTLTADMLNAPLGAVRHAVKHSDFPVGAVTDFRDDPELSILVPARTTWALTTFLICSGTAAGYAQLRIATPSGTQGVLGSGALVASATTNNGQLDMAATPVSNYFNVPVIAAPLACVPCGYLTTASTPGPVTVQFAAAGLATNSPVLHAGSWMTLTRVG